MNISPAVLTLLGLLCCPAVYAAGTAYPPVAPAQRDFHVSSVPDADVSMLIRSRNGVPLYHLQCHSSTYTGDSDFNYSGDFECRLSLANDHDVYSTLLTEDVNQKEDWESRARFFSADLQKPCSSIANFGSTRSFALRGMRLTLQIMHPEIASDGRLASLTLRVIVKPDPLATRAIAAVVSLPKQAPSQCKINLYFPNPASFSMAR